MSFDLETSLARQQLINLKIITLFIQSQANEEWFLQIITLSRPLYIPLWDLNRPGGSRRTGWHELEGRGAPLALSEREGLGPSSACPVGRGRGVSEEALGVTYRSLQLF